MSDEGTHKNTLLRCIKSLGRDAVAWREEAYGADDPRCHWHDENDAEDAANALERERDEAREAVAVAQDYINNILGCPSPDFIATVAACDEVQS